MTEQDKTKDNKYKNWSIYLLLLLILANLAVAGYNYEKLRNMPNLKDYTAECYKYNYDIVKDKFQQLNGCINQTATQMTCYFSDNTTIIVPCDQQILIKHMNNTS